MQRLTRGRPSLVVLPMTSLPFTRKSQDQRAGPGIMKVIGFIVRFLPSPFFNLSSFLSN